MAQDKSSERTRTRLNLYQLIDKLENPDVRLEDNSAYRLNLETIGTLYAYAVSTVPHASSPGIILAQRHSLNQDVLQEYKKSFQRWTRDFFHQRLGELAWRKYTCEELSQHFLPHTFPQEVASNTVEHVVIELAQRAEFQRIGQRLKEGATEYNRLVQRLGMSNYRFVAEYTAILRALQK